MNQQNNNNQAVLPRRSMRLAAVIPASHWISIGYTEVDARLMERLQNVMKKYCDDDDHDDNDKINLVGTLADIIIPHHDMMLPHWKKFVKSIQGRANVKNLRIYKISMPQSVLDIMLPSLLTLNLTKMSLYDTNLGYDGYMKLSSFLKKNTTLINLNLRNKIDDLPVASALSDAVKDHPSLEWVGFINCGLNNIAILEKILEGCKSLDRLLVRVEELESEAVGVLADFIRSNHPTENISMQRCNISDDDTLMLATALKTNVNLRKMSLNGNNITKEGERILLKALYDPSSMDSVIESNHSCSVYTYDSYNTSIEAQRPALEQELLKINRKGKNKGDYSIQRKIRKKVILVLCGVDGSLFDLSHFNDLPLQLMPRVLELIQEHTKMRKEKNTPDQLEKDALSRLFHTLRGWELPLLFTNLRTQVPTGKRKRRKTCRYH